MRCTIGLLLSAGALLAGLVFPQHCASVAMRLVLMVLAACGFWGFVVCAVLKGND